MAWNWDNYKEQRWFGSYQQKRLDEVFQGAYELGEDGQKVENPFKNLPAEHELNNHPDLLLGLERAFDEGLRQGNLVRENREHIQKK
jgi:hypothetical protein